MIPVVDPREQKRQQKLLCDALEHYERQVRNVCARLLEISDPSDDLSFEIRRVLEAFD